MLTYFIKRFYNFKKKIIFKIKFLKLHLLNPHIKSNSNSFCMCFFLIF